MGTFFATVLQKPVPVRYLRLCPRTSLRPVHSIGYSVYHDIRPFPWPAQLRDKPFFRCGLCSHTISPLLKVSATLHMAYRLFIRWLLAS